MPTHLAVPAARAGDGEPVRRVAGAGQDPEVRREDDREPPQGPREREFGFQGSCDTKGHGVRAGRA